MLMSLYHRFIEKDHIDARITMNVSELTADFENWNHETRVKFNMVGRYFEGIGVLRQGLIDVKLVEELLSGPIIRWWEITGSIIQEARKQWNNQAMYDHAEFLYHEMKLREKASPLISA
jgi:hypothetical protein